MGKTIHESIRDLQSSLQDYIEATYHISSPFLIEQRKRLMRTPGAIFQNPYIESTPRYKTGLQYKDIPRLPPAALQLYSALSSESRGHQKLIHDPAYTHQVESIQRALIDGKNLLIMTGTGSGKTESFLLPILGKLAQEAASNPISFRDQAGIRALLLYPMNALVNDQLGRLRAIFGDPRLIELFKSWASRPARFARYTSRTPYAGIRTQDKDTSNLGPFEKFYVDILRDAKGGTSDEKIKAKHLIAELKKRGKWPAKADIARWYGEKRSLWKNKAGEFQRAIMEADDSELLTRHEVQAFPPDLLITNYSMLEYMLMRPIERPIFDQTQLWLKDNPTEKFLIVLDEAHLYRGAAGAEVALLLRRLRDRLQISPDRFQVICATASFQEIQNAAAFGSELSGAPEHTFVPIVGNLNLQPEEGEGSRADAEVLSRIDIDKLYVTSDDVEKKAIIFPILEYRGKGNYVGDIEDALYQALHDFPVMATLVNSTMVSACPIFELSTRLFPSSPVDIAERATTTLIALGSIARRERDSAGLLPCRLHNFFRGLPGLWVCMDPNCSEVSELVGHKICGKLYSQPRQKCDCGACVLELFTCRNCGTAYTRAYTNNLENPLLLWSDPGRYLRFNDDVITPLFPLDLLLETPRHEQITEHFEYDLESGLLNPDVLGSRTRKVYLPTERIRPISTDASSRGRDPATLGQFVPCAVCKRDAHFGESSVQDHQTSGDQPFQSLVARQIQIQPPGPQPATRFAPLQGRKVLVFSDSRQTAARLAPHIQMYSVRDALRPLIAWGFRELENVPTLKSQISLEDLYLAVLIAANKFGTRLRPELKANENFTGETIVEEAYKAESIDYLGLWGDIRSQKPPEALLENIINTIQHPYLGLEALAIASISEKPKHRAAIDRLPPISGIAETSEGKVSLVRTWIRCWSDNGFWLERMPTTWLNRPRKKCVSVKSHKGNFTMKSILTNASQRKVFAEKWQPELLQIFTERIENGEYRLRGNELSLLFGGIWLRCSSCTSVQRPVVGISYCIDCSSSDIHQIDPDSDPVFLARTAYYRNPVTSILDTSPRAPMVLVAAEHTAQLNASHGGEIFSKAEQNELLFQDVMIAWKEVGARATAIDVLSSTTTMEVGIDIGSLSGVALRNMPPSRANYQQRAGRAGRRGNSIATVVAYGSVDSHDEHYFSDPDGMIRGKVIDPKLTLDNLEITKRHIRAFLLQQYHQDRLPNIAPHEQPSLFSVLGSVSDFLKQGSILNRYDFSAWIAANENVLRERLKTWIPKELSSNNRDQLLNGFKEDCCSAIDEALNVENPSSESDGSASVTAESWGEAPDPVGSTLLEKLLYKGILPRYAFPTDVSTFHVFDLNGSDFRPSMKFTPSQSLPIALSQYAPGKQIWISGKCYTSGAIYSFLPSERKKAWAARKLYIACEACGFAETISLQQQERPTICRACGTRLGALQQWFRPTGFAHPVDVDEMTSPDEIPETSYATRAKLTMSTPDDEAEWIGINTVLRSFPVRGHLLVSNTGPNDDGYSYCVTCGRIEAAGNPRSILSGSHQKPFPDKNSPSCSGGNLVQHIVLGTDFVTDIALFSIRLLPPYKLAPGDYVFDVALRTVSEALTKAAAKMLGIEARELLAEYRPALTEAGRKGMEVEIFLYDTLPGGAGFAQQLTEFGDDLFREALTILKDCPESCDASCYRCLRSFGNRIEHALLDRHVGSHFLESALSGGSEVAFDTPRLLSSTKALFSDLSRYRDLKIEAEYNFSVPSILVSNGDVTRRLILVAPLTDISLASLKIQARNDSQTIFLNELLIRAALPLATGYVLQNFGLDSQDISTRNYPVGRSVSPLDKKEAVTRKLALSYVSDQLGSEKKWAGINRRIWDVIAVATNNSLTLSEVDRIAETTESSLGDVLTVLAVASKMDMGFLRMEYVLIEGDVETELSVEQVTSKFREWWKYKSISENEWQSWASKVLIRWRLVSNEVQNGGI